MVPSSSFITEIWGKKDDQENGWYLNPPITVSSRPVQVHTEGFVNFRSGTDAWYDDYRLSLFVMSTICM